METKAPLETTLLDDFVLRLRQILRSDWSVRRARLPQPGLWQPDAVLEIRAPDRTRGRLAIAVQPRLYPRDVLSQRPLWRSLADRMPVLVLTGVLTPRTREVLDQANLSYADAVGALRLVMPQPAVSIEHWTEARRRPPPERRELQSLKTAAAGRGVRALCDLRPPYGVREFASRAGLSPATASRLFDLLDREALIERDSPRLPVRKVDWAGLVRRWADDYSFAKSNRVEAVLEPRGLPALLRKLASYPAAYAVTGSQAAYRLNPIAPTRLAMLFVVDAQRAIQELELRPTDAGANVLLAEPFDAVVFERTQSADGVRYAAPSQVVADLLNGPGRSPQEAEALLEWMAAHKAAWQA
ncbi:MAG: hypothetical protein ACRDG7_08600 [Candidatus Limnocylindria bacterium]